MNPNALVNSDVWDIPKRTFSDKPPANPEEGDMLIKNNRQYIFDEGVWKGLIMSGKIDYPKNYKRKRKINKIF